MLASEPHEKTIFLSENQTGDFTSRLDRPTKSTVTIHLLITDYLGDFLVCELIDLDCRIGMDGFVRIYTP